MEWFNKASFVLFTAEEVAEGAEEESKDIEKEQKGRYEKNCQSCQD